MAASEKYQVVVQKVVPEGRHGPYAVVLIDPLGSVTFSLDATVWQEEEWPKPGEYVVLSQLRRKRAGWRANHARFQQPGD